MTRLKGIYNYLIPLGHYSELSGIQLIDYISSAKLTVQICLLSLTTCLAIIVSNLYFDIFNWLQISLYILIAAYSGALFMLRKTGSFRVITYLIILAYCILPPLHIYFINSPTNPNFIWYSCGIITAGALFGKKASVFYTIMVLLFTAIIKLLPPPNFVSPLHTADGAYLYYDIFGLFATLIPLAAIIEKEKYIKKEIVGVEKIRIINLLITSLSENINNPLTVAQGNLIKLRKLEQEDARKKIEESLNQIADVVKEISLITDPDEIITEPYREVYEKLKLKSENSR